MLQRRQLQAGYKEGEGHHKMCTYSGYSSHVIYQVNIEKEIKNVKAMAMKVNYSNK